MRGSEKGVVGGDPSSAVFRVRVACLESAVEIPSLATDRLCQAAGDAGIDVALGVAERDRNTHGTTYCTLLFIGSEEDGSSLRVYKREYAAIGGLSCWGAHDDAPRLSLGM